MKSALFVYQFHIVSFYIMNYNWSMLMTLSKFNLRSSKAVTRTLKNYLMGKSVGLS